MSKKVFYQAELKKKMIHMRKPLNFILVPTVSIIVGIIAYLLLSGMLVFGFNPLREVAEGVSSGSFIYVTKELPYETCEVSYNMEDLYNSTHLNDFSPKGHLGKKAAGLQFEAGVYGQSLRWPSGEIVCENLNIAGMSFTLEAWIYPTSEGSISLAGCETIYAYPYIWKYENGSMHYRYAGGSGYFFSNQSVGLNSWTHVALVYEVGSGVAKWYLNGLERGAKQVGFALQWDGVWSIGRMKPGSSYLEWKGKIDEFRIYKGVALTQSKIQQDMKTSIAHKFKLTGLVPNSDIAQLWYPDGKFAQEHMLEETADENGQVEFNVYSFSGRSSPYNGVLKVVHSGRTYASQVLSLSWEDVYNFSLNTSFTETLVAGFVSSLIIIVPIATLIVYRFMHKPSKAAQHVNFEPAPVTS